MKYMTFKSSCSYAGIANMLPYFGVETEDYKIALEMKLPLLFTYDTNTHIYMSGPMLQSAEWFDIYLKPLGLKLNEYQCKKEHVLDYLNDNECAMLGVYINEEQKHAVIYNGYEDGIYRFINNKQIDSNEPDVLKFTKDELLATLDDTVFISTIIKANKEIIDLAPLLQKSIKVLNSMKKELINYCSMVKTPHELRESMNEIFRAVLLDSITMLELMGEEKISAKLRLVQSSFLSALRKGESLILSDYIPMQILQEAIDEYIELIQKEYDSMLEKA